MNQAFELRKIELKKENQKRKFLKKDEAEKVKYGLKYKDKKYIYEILRSEKSH